MTYCLFLGSGQGLFCPFILASPPRGSIKMAVHGAERLSSATWCNMLL